MSSVTEQMLIHSQEFNVRLDNTDNTIREIHQEIMSKLFAIQDKVDVLELLFKEIELRLKDISYG